ncbi:MAG: hypothetical protein KF726_21315 [Anaerolineae bacterium]|nr:hypothetical protein [Anaerolineae bacterium]
MSKSRLLLNVTGYGSYLGLGWGIVIGIIFYLIAFQFSISIYSLYFALLGAICGVLLGGINGAILWATIARSHSHLLHLLVSVTTTFILSLVIFTIISSLYSAFQQSVFPLLLLASVLAAAAAAYLSQPLAAFIRKYADPPSAL